MRWELSVTGPLYGRFGLLLTLNFGNNRVTLAPERNGQPVISIYKKPYSRFGGNFCSSGEQRLGIVERYTSQQFSITRYAARTLYTPKNSVFMQHDEF